LIAWQLAHEFKLAVYDLARRSAAHRDRYYWEHLQRTAVSVELNIVEGYHRNSRGDFARFLLIAVASLAETEAQLRDGVDRRLLSQGDITPAVQWSRRTSGAIHGLRRSLWRHAPRP
jgi:four helix bundle protein